MAPMNAPNTPIVSTPAKKTRGRPMRLARLHPPTAVARVGRQGEIKRDRAPIVGGGQSYLARNSILSMNTVVCAP